MGLMMEDMPEPGTLQREFDRCKTDGKSTHLIQVTPVTFDLYGTSWGSMEFFPVEVSPEALKSADDLRTLFKNIVDDELERRGECYQALRDLRVLDLSESFGESDLKL